MPLLGSAILANWSNVAPLHRPPYYEWHVKEHMPGRIAVDGFLRGRRYAGLEGQYDFFQFYELDDAGVLESHDYLALAAEHTPATTAALSTIRDSLRLVADVVISEGAGQGGILLTERISLDPATIPEALRHMRTEALPALLAAPNVTATHLCLVRSGIDVASDPTCIALIEGISQDAVRTARDNHLSTESLLRHGAARESLSDCFRLEFAITPADAVKHTPEN
jgi:hypothetical protein